MSEDATKAEVAFRSAVRGHLEVLSAQLMESLRVLITHAYPPDFWLLDFEVHTDDRFGLGWPICVYFFRREFDQISDSDPDASMYPLQQVDPLVQVSRFCPKSLLSDFAITPDDYWHELATEAELIEWFHHCWLAAGGEAFRYRAMIAPHDVARRLDLRTGRWVEED